MTTVGIDGTISDALPPSTRQGIQGQQGAKGDPGPSGIAELVAKVLPGEAASTDGNGNVVSLPVVSGVGLDGSSLGPGFDILIGAGQSNMSGRGSEFDLTHFEVPDSRIVQYGDSGTYKDLVSVAVDPLAHHDTPIGLGPLGNIARAYLPTIAPTRRVMLLPVAHGGTGFEADTGSGFRWKVGYTPSGSNLYTNLRNQVTKALAAAGPGTHRIVGVFWVQGEADSTASVPAATYEDDLDELVDALRADLGVADLPFVVGQMVPAFLDLPSAPTRRAINDVHVDLPRRRTRTGFAYGPVGAGFDKADGDHYSSAGQRRLAASMFAAFVRARANVTGTPPVAVAGAPTMTQQGTTIYPAWQQSPGRVTDYNVRYRQQGSGSWTALTRAQSIEVSAAIADLTIGQTYEVQVQAVNAEGVSAWSATGTITTIAPPAQVTGLATGTPTSSAVPLSWTAVAGATSYVVEQSPAGAGTWTTAATVTGTSTTVANLAASTAYDFRVRAANLGGTGTASSTATATTPAPPTVLGVAGAAFEAWSLRKVVSDYTGAAVRVRRSTDNAEQDFGFASGVLDQAALTTWLGAASGFVVTLYDQTGNGRHLTQATAGNQPRIANAGVIDTSGGKPAMVFTAASQQYLSRAGAGLFAAGAATVARVEVVPSTGTRVVFGESRSTGSDARYLAGYIGNALWSWITSNNAAVRALSATAIPATADNAIHQVTTVDTGTAASLYQDGAAKATNLESIRSGTSTLDRTTIGAFVTSSVGQPYNNPISEVVAWGSALGAVDRQTVEANQRAFYGTP